MGSCLGRCLHVASACDMLICFAKLINLWTSALITPAYTNRCKQTIFLQLLISYYFLSGVWCGTVTSALPALLFSTSLVAPGCLCSLHHCSSFTFGLLINVAWSVICIPLISAFHPRFLSAPSLSSLSSGAAGHLGPPSAPPLSLLCSPLCVHLLLLLSYFFPEGSLACFVPDCRRIRIPHHPVNCTFIWQDRGARATPGIIKL